MSISSTCNMYEKFQLEEGTTASFCLSTPVMNKFAFCLLGAIEVTKVKIHTFIAAAVSCLFYNYPSIMSTFHFLYDGYSVNTSM